MAKLMFENIQLYFLLIKKKKNLAGENTSVLIILAITIYINNGRWNGMPYSIYKWNKWKK